MSGNIVKLASGRVGIAAAGKAHVYVSGNAEQMRYGPPAIPTNTDPIAEELPTTKGTTLAVSDVLSRFSTAVGNTSGSDPEVFAFAPDGEVLPAWTFLPDKSKPLVAQRSTYDPVMAAKAQSYWDGAQAEVTLTAGETCHAQLVDSIRFGLKSIYDAAIKHTPGAYLACKDVVKIPDNILMAAEEQHIALGCSPSLNAYKSIKPIDIGDPRQHPVRYSGCHLHFRHKFVAKTPEGKVQYGPNLMVYKAPYNPIYSVLPDWFPQGTVKMFDRVVGLLLTALGRDLEDPLRRKAYGRPGEYRQTAEAGIEYRTPGAFVLCRPEVLNFAMDMGRRSWALGLLYNPETFFLPGAMDIIMNCDADEAFRRIEKFKPFFASLFQANGYSIEGTMEILRKGLVGHGLVPPMLEAWKLDKPVQDATNPAGWAAHNDGDRLCWNKLSHDMAAKIAVPATAPVTAVEANVTTAGAQPMLVPRRLILT